MFNQKHLRIIILQWCVKITSYDARASFRTKEKCMILSRDTHCCGKKHLLDDNNTDSRNKCKPNVNKAQIRKPNADTCFTAALLIQAKLSGHNIRLT